MLPHTLVILSGSFMPLVSSAQNQEDIMLWRALRQVRDGFYIDVGAADPAALSVTRIFYEHGWRGINLEPNPDYFAALSKARPRDINLAVGVGREAGPKTFYDVGSSGLSTLDAAIAAHHRTNGWTVTEQTIEILTLAEICRRHRPEGPIHFLKVDVEGGEGDVLAGADFGAFRPWIVLVEATLPLSQERSYAAWEPILTDQGYTFVWFDGLNRFYVSNETESQLREHFLVQPNVFDEFLPASALLERAEQAEQGLRQAEVQATQTARDTAEAQRRTAAAMQETAVALAHQSNLTAEAQRRTAEAMQETAAALAHQSNLTAEAQRQASQIIEQTTETARRAAEAMQQNAIALAKQSSLTAQAQQRASDMADRLAEVRLQHARTLEETSLALAAVAEAQHAARRAEERVAELLSSTSWRLTAPIRMVRRLLPGRRTGQPSPILPAADPPGKELARQVFHRGMRRLLRLPGGRRSSRLIYAIVPGPVEWLALRYRAYEQRGADQRRAPDELHAAAALPVPGGPRAKDLPAAATVEETGPVPAVTQQVLLDLSEEEARLYRQFGTGGLVALADTAMA
jgi:FkbM family methyltransferase